MENLVPDIFRFLIKAVLLLGSAMVTLWFYFRIRPKPPPLPSYPSPESEGRSGILLQLKLQACERLILFLERITPDNLILRMHMPDMTASQLQAAAIRTVREEFDYNLSQQLYVSTSTWERIRNAKEETISQINRAASLLKEGGTGRDLAAAILGLAVVQERSVVLAAIEAVKREIA